MKPKMSAGDEERMRRAQNVMNGVRDALLRRMSDYILKNRRRLQDEVNADEGYSFTLQQMEEQFLSKLGVVERVAGELARNEPRENAVMTTTYHTVEIVAKREELPQKVADALADHGDADFLDLSVLRADEKQAEVLLVLARQDPLPPAVAATTAAAASPEPENRARGEAGEPGSSSSTGTSELGGHGPASGSDGAAGSEN